MPSKYAKKKSKAPKVSKAVKKYVKKAVKHVGETKHVEKAQLAWQPIDATGFIGRVSDTTQGTTDQNRIGDQIQPVSIELGFFMWTDTSNPVFPVYDSYNQCRVILFQWHEDDAFNSPIQSDILLYSYYQNIANVDIQMVSPYNWDQRHLFTVLYDNTYTIRPDVVGYPEQVLFKEHISIPVSRKIFYNAGGVSGSNNIYIMVVTDSTTPAHPNIQYLTQLRFKDA